MIKLLKKSMQVQKIEPIQEFMLEDIKQIIMVFESNTKRKFDNTVPVTQGNAFQMCTELLILHTFTLTRGQNIATILSSMNTN